MNDPTVPVPWPHCPTALNSLPHLPGGVQRCAHGPIPSTRLEESPVYHPREEVAALLCYHMILLTWSQPPGEEPNHGLTVSQLVDD